MHDAKQLELWKDRLPSPLLQSMLISEHLTRQLNATPLDMESIDLNPDIEVKKIVTAVTEAVIGEGVFCSDEVVMLYWLTVMLYKGTSL